MKVLNLRCAHGHPFEGWFGSEADFVGQQERSMIACPTCGDHGISRLPSAPRLNLSGAQAPQGAPPSTAKETSKQVSTTAPEAPLEPQHAWWKALKEVYANTEDVGRAFPEEVRRIHYGETEARALRGQATAAQRAELQDEGIEIFALPNLPGEGEPSH
jgi:hypothetical protein